MPHLPIENGEKRIAIPRVTSYVEQVCPLPDERLAVFVNAYQATNVLIVNSMTGNVIDLIDAINPLMSPDQRWIAFETFHPEHTELPVSSSYRLYDLHKTPAQNRMTGTSSEDFSDAGKVVFPLVDGNGDSEKRHEEQLRPLVWAQNSHAFAFLDSVDGEKSLILVKVADNGETASYMHKLTGLLGCENPDIPPQRTWDNLRVEIGTGDNPPIQLSVQGVRDCTPTLTTLTFEDFSPADHERSRKQKKSVITNR